jgi:electron transfer flavoprotein beta subunit
MKVAVCVKHAIDESELKVDAQGRPQLQGAQTKMSTFDRNAVEEAVRIKEAKGGGTTTTTTTTVEIITLGAADAKKSIKESLAMGADAGRLIISPPEEHDTITTSYYLARAIQKIGGVDLVICSEGSSDTYHGYVGAMIAEWLSLPYIGYVRKIEIGKGMIRCEEALEDRVEVSEAPLPAVISVVSEINEPRYPTLLQIMQASKKPIEELKPDSLREGDAPKKLVEVSDIRVQASSRKRVIFEGSPEESAKKLIDELVKEGVLKKA